MANIQLQENQEIGADVIRRHSRNHFEIDKRTDGATIKYDGDSNRESLSITVTKNSNTTADGKSIRSAKMGSSKQVSGILDGNVLKINRTDNITHGELLMLTAYLTESFSNRNSFSKIKIITKREYRNILEGN